VSYKGGNLALGICAPPLAASLSPVLLLGLVLEKLPARLMQVAANAVWRIVRHQHPDCLERMEAWSDRVVCIDPIDLPFVILLRPDAKTPHLTVRRRAEQGEADATIHGPLEMLIALAEGRIDGDTLFFSRELVVEGDTEVVVALRNAVDGAGIDLVADIGKALGPFGRPFRGITVAAGMLGRRLSADLTTLANAVIAPALRVDDEQALRIATLEAELAVLHRAGRRHART
jgi:O2-independent ubiquinone biosynthesis accessory factor UbiT